MLNSVKAKKTLYFTTGMETSEEDMAAINKLGAGVSVRNAEFVDEKPNPGQIEKCDFVAGHVPKPYAHYPRHPAEGTAAPAAPAAPAPVAPPAPPAAPTEQPQPPSAVPPAPSAPQGGAWAGAPVVPPAPPQS